MVGSAIDVTFRALSDPTRRRILERLAKGPAAASELARRFQMKLPSFIDHLRVLEEARLVSSKKMGRVRTYRATPERLEAVQTWIARQVALYNSQPEVTDSVE